MTTRIDILKMLEERLRRDAAKPCTVATAPRWEQCNSCEAKEELTDVEAKLKAVEKI